MYVCPTGVLPVGFFCFGELGVGRGIFVIGDYGCWDYSLFAIGSSDITVSRASGKEYGV